MKLVLLFLIFSSNYLCLLSENTADSAIPESRKNDIFIPSANGQNIKVSFSNNVNALSVDGHIINTSNNRKLETMYPYTDSQLQIYLQSIASADTTTTAGQQAVLTANIPPLQAAMVAFQVSIQANPTADLTTVSLDFMTFILAELTAIESIITPPVVPPPSLKRRVNMKEIDYMFHWLRKANRAGRRVDFESLSDGNNNMSRFLRHSRY